MTIRASTNFNVDNSGFSGTSSESLTMTGSNYVGQVVTIGTTFTQLFTGSCSNLKYVWIKNLSTASIDVAIASTSQSFTRLEYNQALPLPGTSSLNTYWVRATSASADIKYCIVES
jgi:hypothetical protein